MIIGGKIYIVMILKAIKHKIIYFFIIWHLVFLIAFTVFLSFYTGIIISVCINGIFALILYCVYRLFLKKISFIFNQQTIIISLFGSIGFSLISWQFISFDEYSQDIRISFLFIISLILLIFPTLYLIYLFLDTKGISKIDSTKKRNIFDTKLYFVAPFVLTFSVLFVFQPYSLYVNNIDEMPFAFIELLFSELYFIGYLMGIIYILYLLPLKVLKKLSVCLSLINICIYIQLLMFNKYVVLLLGNKYDWKIHPIYSILNVLIYIFFILFSLIFLKKNSIYLIVLNIIIFCMLLSGLTFEIITNRSKFKDYNDPGCYYLDNSNQYTIGSENIVFLVADAVDNSYVKEILSDDLDFFEDFNDFTLYTNTCSVYESTSLSVPQILFGDTQINNSERSLTYVNRLYDSGYRFNIFNYNALGAPGNPERYFSNYKYSDDVALIRKDRIRSTFFTITLYQIAPCIFKQYIKAEKVDFNYCLDFNPRNTSKIDFDNDDFENNLNLSLSNEKLFIYQHIRGAHVPCDDYVAETEHCLNIFKEYIKQMKELGCYDNSIIIICADHGKREVSEAFAATPMFLMKGNNEKHDKMVVTDKPLYYQDIQATILKDIGLYQNGDESVFGKSIYDYDENEQRIRVWFDAVNTEIRKYNFIGDYKDFEKVVKNDEYVVVEDYSFDYFCLDD